MVPMIPNTYPIPNVQLPILWGEGGGGTTAMVNWLVHRDIIFYLLTFKISS